MLARRVLQSNDTSTRVGYLFAAPDHGATGDDILRDDVPAHAPFVRLTLHPDTAADRVVATLEPLRPPPGAETSRAQDLRGNHSETEPSRSTPLHAEGFEVDARPSYVRILEAIAQGEFAASTAASVSALLEEQAEGLTAVVMRYDATTQTLHHLTSPSLDDASRTGLRGGLPVQECALCRTAVQGHARQRHDPADDAWLEVINPAWHAAFNHANARTCWTIPIMRGGADVLGVIVLLFDAPQRYAATDPALIKTSAQLIHIALERDRRARDLREHTGRLRQMTETMQDVFGLRTADNILHVSDSFEDVWGRPVEDLYADADSYLEDVHPDDRDDVSDTCRKLPHEEQPISTEYRVIRKSDGETRWVRAHFRPVGNEAGPARFAGTIRDATDEIESQKQLKMSEQTYRNLIDHASDAIYVQNEDSEFLDLSESAIQMYGYARKQLLGKTPAFVSAPGKNDLDRVERFFADALDGKPQQFEFWGPRSR